MWIDDGSERPKPREGVVPEPSEYLCLIRARSKSRKISTVVNQNEVPKFMELFGKSLKTNMDGLKKIKKTKNKGKAAQGWGVVVVQKFYSSVFLINN